MLKLQYQSQKSLNELNTFLMMRNQIRWKCINKHLRLRLTKIVYNYIINWFNKLVSQVYNNCTLSTMNYFFCISFYLKFVESHRQRVSPSLVFRIGLVTRSGIFLGRHKPLSTKRLTKSVHVVKALQL